MMIAVYVGAVMLTRIVLANVVQAPLLAVLVMDAEQQYSITVVFVQVVQPV